LRGVGRRATIGVGSVPRPLAGLGPPSPVTVHARHLAVHQYRVEASSEHATAWAILRNDDLATALFEHRDGDLG
jgi:hypothetical protein